MADERATDDPADKPPVPAPGTVNPAKQSIFEIILSASRNLWRIYPSDGISPTKLKRIMREADIGWTPDWMELLDDVANDAHVGMVLGTRKRAIAGAPRRMEPPELPPSTPESTKKLARTIADDADAWVKRIPCYSQLLLDLMDAHYRGFACSQPIYKAVGKYWDIVRHKPIESRFFRFDYGTNPLVMTEANPGGEPLPLGVLWHEVRERPGIVSRGGTGRAIVKPWLYKGLNLVDCASYLERFGHPLVKLTHGPNIVEGSPDYEAAKAAARALVTDMIAMLPVGADIEIMSDLNKADNIDRVYIAFMRFMDEQISKAEGYGAQTVDAGPSGIGHGQEQRGQQSIRQDVKEFDATGLEDTLQSQLFRAFTLYHYGEKALWLTPRQILDVSEAEDQVQKTQAQLNRVNVFLNLKNAGFKIAKSQVQRDIELDVPEPGDEWEGATPKEPGKPPKPAGDDDEEDDDDEQASSAAGRGQTYVDRLRADASTRAANALSPDLADVLAEIAASSDAADLRARLVKRFDKMDPTALADVVRRSRILAELSGRLTVLEDA